ncbi:hypothetical protein BGZ65_009366, partial [Modicella reniformis]
PISERTSRSSSPYMLGNNAPVVYRPQNPVKEVPPPYSATTSPVVTYGTPVATPTSPPGTPQQHIVANGTTVQQAPGGLYRHPSMPQGGQYHQVGQQVYVQAMRPQIGQPAPMAYRPVTVPGVQASSQPQRLQQPVVYLQLSSSSL